MSGLALFFRDHLQSEADTNDYSTSLRDCETKPAQSQSFEENTALSQFAEKGDYEKWRDSRDNFLLCYFALRFSTHSDATEIEPASPRNQLTFPPDETDSPRLETQNNIFSAETEQHSPHENIRIVIPDVRETHHHAERIRDIDLLAKSVTLLLCKAEKRFAFRQSQRAQFTCGTVPHPMYIHTGTSMANLPRLTLGGFQEDGPLRSYYKTVVNFEMKQVQDDISLLRQRAEYLEEDHIRAERIHVFFYGKYAETLDSILRSQQSHNLYFSIQNVPHRCVFPYPASGWYEAHDLSACCLGIGDWSAKMEVAGEEGNEVNHSFDHPDMRIFVATGSRLETIEHVSLLTPCRENGVTVENVEIENSPFFDLAEQFPLTVVSELDYDYYTIVSNDLTHMVPFRCILTAMYS